MVALLIGVLGLVLSAEQAWALPSAVPSNVGSTKPLGLGRWDMWTIPNPAYDPYTYNITQPLLQTRQDPGDRSESEVGQSIVIVTDENAPEGQPVYAFGMLFDAVADELCTATGCIPTNMKCVTASPTQDVCIMAQGNWFSNERSYYLEATRQLFERTVVYSWSDPAQCGDPICIWPGAVEVATDIISITKQDSVGGDGFLRIELMLQDKGGASCPDYVKTIAAGGALAGSAAPFFGLIGLLCDGIEMASI